MVGRGDKGLFITTGTFTPAARAEAQRAGAPPIDLIGGDRLIDLLKEHSLGVGVELVESVTIDPSFFDSF
jgi:restriction system protein